MIAIKDIEMPTSCYNCPFAENKRTDDYGSFCECGILDDCETINLLEHSKHSDCPLIEIVTCKDCEYNGTMRCKCFMSDGHEYMSYNNPNFYCADAKKRVRGSITRMW